MIDPNQKSGQTESEANEQRDLVQERYRILGSIPDAFASKENGGRALKTDQPVAVEHFSTTDEGESIGATVTRSRFKITNASRAWTGPDDSRIAINGHTERRGSFPMYNVTAVVPGTDSGYLPAHFVVEAIDEGGEATPIMCVMQSPVGVPSRKTRGSYSSFFNDVIDRMPEVGLAELQETGLYVDPSAKAQLDEVKTILELAIAQQEDPHQHPTLPLDFVSHTAA